MVVLYLGWGISLVAGLLASLGLLGRIGRYVMLPAIALFILIGLVLGFVALRFPSVQ